MPYATASQMLTRIDNRLLGELAVDDNTRLSATPLLTSARLLASLSDASGDIDDALRAGYRYTASELASLASASNVSLIRMCCGLALGYMYASRGRVPGETHQRIIDEAQRRLEDLRAGKTVLHNSTNQTSTAETEILSVTDRNTLGMMADCEHFRTRRSELA